MRGWIILLLSLLRYIKGTVDFYAEGADIESFYSYCAKNSTEILYPRKKGYSLYAFTEAKNYKKLRIPARKRGIKIKILKKHGLYFDLKKNRTKLGFAAGTLFTAVFCVFMSFFIWEINVIGNNEVSEENIIKSANEMGLFTGTASSKHFVQDMEWYILRENPKLASVEINIQGSIANILVNERKEEPEMVSDDDIPTNIVASKYGIIRKINVFDGKGTVKPGDAVMKGDLLVSAVFEDRHNKLTLKHARAEVLAETDYFIEARFPLEQTFCETDKFKGLFLEVYFLGKSIEIGKTKNLPKETTVKEFKFFTVNLPVKLIITRYFDVKENNITYNFEYGKEAAHKLLLKKEKEELSEAEIISKRTQETIKNGEYIINSEYIVIIDIAEEQPIESDVPWENTDDMS